MFVLKRKITNGYFHPESSQKTNNRLSFSRQAPFTARHTSILTCHLSKVFANSPPRSKVKTFYAVVTTSWLVQKLHPRSMVFSPVKSQKTHSAKFGLCGKILMFFPSEFPERGCNTGKPVFVMPNKLVLHLWGLFWLIRTRWRLLFGQVTKGFICPCGTTPLFQHFLSAHFFLTRRL